MRLTAYGEIERSWLINALHDRDSQAGLDDFLSRLPSAPRRRVLFIRLSQTLSELLAAIPRWRLRELAHRASQDLPEALPPVQELLRSWGIDLAPALDIHAAMGGDARIVQINRIGTHFTALLKGDIEALHSHARWQVHAMRAIYWDLPGENVQTS